ncbi:MAG TPA: RNA pseudouridine synthase, partial [Methylomirabilota bacterium]|nr:RNA pseudouridine synthase [Methylomirabilota bacterium]
SGLLVFAKSPAVKAMLQRQFQARMPERLYQARVDGVVRQDEGTLSSRLVEDRSLRVRTTRAADRGREAITRYRVLERFADATLLELKLVTGRRGQIRAQLAALGHPLTGDRAYGSRRDPFKRVCLHATRLGFTHPDGRRVVYESRAPSVFRRTP